MLTPLNDIINRYKEHISFHTPAHSGVGFLEESYLKSDITELSYSDNLLCPRDVILASEKEAASAYKSQGCIYLTNGATGGMHTVIHAFRHKVLLVAGVCHKSIFSAVRLYNVKAFYTQDTSNLDSDIEKHKIEVVILTSPDYFGRVTDFSIKSEVIVVVDEAHGSHFMFSKLLPPSSIAKADIVVHSLHKTLPALTGAATIHFKHDFRDILYCSLNEIHSTSPSYLTLASIEASINDFSMHGGTIYQKVIAEIAEFNSNLPKDFEVLKTDDKTRLVIASNYNPDELNSYLEHNGIFSELTYKNQIVFIVTFFNMKHLRRLSALLKNHPPFSQYQKEEEYPCSKNGLRRIEVFKDFELVPIAKAEGKRLYKEIGLYPPGTPLMLSGEILSKEMIDFINRNQNRLFGLDKARVFVVK